MALPSLPLSDVIDVTVSVSAQSVLTPTFNEGLIIGNSGVIPSQGNNSRCRQYSALSQMIADGFTTSMPEYLGAEMYFGQNPSAQYLWVGCQDTTAIGTAVVDAGHGGTGWAIGDQFTIAGVTGAIGQVLTETGGVVGTFSLVNQGTGATVENGVACTAIHGSGTGLEINITALGETLLEAVTACRNAQSAWYAVFCCGAVDADILAIAAYAQATIPSFVFFYNTADAAVLYNSTGNVAAALQAAEYSRVFGMYSTTQSGGAPNNAYIAAGAMGVAMGLNTGLANSYYTMKFKEIIGGTPEPLTQSQVTALEDLNINLYVNYQNGSFEWLEQGVMANGQFFDQIINIDQLSADIQYSLANLLVGAPSIPQNNAGQAILINVVNAACARAATRGFISGGIWEGVTLLNLSAGTALPSGYLTQSPPYSSVSQSDISARQAAPIYVALIEAGAVHFIAVAVTVQV